MKKALKKAWIKDLKNNPQAKGEGNLCYKQAGKTRWCCLGRLADIALSFDWVQVPSLLDYRIVWATNAKDGDFDYLSTNQYATEVLSNKQLAKVGLDPEDQSELVELNDSSDNWEKVIKYIEDNVKED